MSEADKNPHESLSALRYLQQMYQNQYMLLAQEINNRIAVLDEMSGGESALKRMEQVRGAHALIDIGGGTYIGAAVDKSDSVLVHAGAGCYVEKSAANADAHMAKIMEKQRTMLGKLMSSRKQLEQTLVEISYRMSKISEPDV